MPAAAASGNHTNTTSGVAATVEGLSATSAPASDGLLVSGLIFSKEFTDDPVIPGDTATLRFTIENLDPLNDAAAILFTDSLTAGPPGAGCRRSASGGPVRSGTF